MVDILDCSQIALVRDKPFYNQLPPFHPSEDYPEWPGSARSNHENPAYRAVRLSLYYLKLDANQFDTPDWNPMEKLVHPGNTVFLKPNFVYHRNLGENAYGLTDTDSLITHGSIIRCVLDYVAKAMYGHGRIIIGDCPIQGAEWDKVIRLAGLFEISDYFSQTFPGIDLSIKDYRLGIAIFKGQTVIKRVVDHRGGANYTEIDLGSKSELAPLMQENYSFGVAEYSRERMRKAHTAETNKYLIPKDVIDADMVINLPKLKSHMKAGISCSMKNLVGIVGHKDYLPHFRYGSPRQGGDEYPDGDWLWDRMWGFYHKGWDCEQGLRKQFFYNCGKMTWLLCLIAGYKWDYKSIGAGGWYGNDTLWRTILDVNRAYFYFDRIERVVRDQIPTSLKCMTILDGLVGGQKESPLSPTPFPSGLVMASF